MDFPLSLAHTLLLFNADFRRVLAFLNVSGLITNIDEEGRVSKEEASDERRKLPEDCVYEILSRVNAITLPSCLRVCQSWRRLAFEPTFDALHSLRTKTMSGFLLGTSDRFKMNYSFLSTDSHKSPFSVTSLLPRRRDAVVFTIQATSPAHCLLLCKETVYQPSRNYIQNHAHYLSNYYVTRLGTPHHRRIPNPRVENLEYSTCIFVIDNGAFKIVRIYTPRWKRRRKPCKCISEIFDSTIGHWRFSTHLPYIYGLVKNAVVVKQTAYWLVFEMNRIPRILSFDVEKERGRVVPVPTMINSSAGWLWKWQLLACEDKLCLMKLSNGVVKVWVMKEDAGEFNGWEWKGLVSIHRLMDHKFAFEDGIQSHQVVLLETLYRELWYKLKGHEYVDWIHPPMHVWRLCMDVADLKIKL